MYVDCGSMGCESCLRTRPPQRFVRELRIGCIWLWLDNSICNLCEGCMWGFLEAAWLPKGHRCGGLGCWGITREHPISTSTYVLGMRADFDALLLTCRWGIVTYAILHTCRWWRQWWQSLTVEPIVQRDTYVTFCDILSHVSCLFGLVSSSIYKGDSAKIFSERPYVRKKLR